MQVVINGFKPLCFETHVEFHSGKEILISLRYEGLFVFCRKCFSLCHEEKDCPPLAEGGDGPRGDSDSGATMLSYKGAVEHRRNQTHEGNKAWKHSK